MSQGFGSALGPGPDGSCGPVSLSPWESKQSPVGLPSTARRSGGPCAPQWPGCGVLQATPVAATHSQSGDPIPAGPSTCLSGKDPWRPAGQDDGGIGLQVQGTPGPGMQCHPGTGDVGPTQLLPQTFHAHRRDFCCRLNGKEHSVFTGVAIIHCSSQGTRAAPPLSQGRGGSQGLWMTRA